MTSVEQAFARDYVNGRPYTGGFSVCLWPCVDRLRSYRGCQGEAACDEWRAAHGLPPGCLLRSGRSGGALPVEPRVVEDVRAPEREEAKL